jgi:hypothetical protein
VTWKATALAEMPTNRVNQLDKGIGVLSAAAASLKTPRGLWFSPEGSTPYVADSGPAVRAEAPADETAPRAGRILACERRSRKGNRPHCRATRTVYRTEFHATKTSACGASLAAGLSASMRRRPSRRYRDT